MSTKKRRSDGEVGGKMLLLSINTGFSCGTSHTRLPGRADLKFSNAALLMRPFSFFMSVIPVAHICARNVGVVVGFLFCEAGAWQHRLRKNASVIGTVATDPLLSVDV